MFGTIWHDFLYQPLFNALIWFYNNWADQNFGWAVVYLTVMIRLVLLPFTVVTEKTRLKNEELYEDVKRVDQEFKKDPILKKEEIRKILKKRKVHPWAKSVVLGAQLLALILLYQVFLRGITGEKIAKILYLGVDFPGKINTIFFGFDLAATRDWLWSGAVAIWLGLEIYLGLRKRKAQMADLVYFIFFPAFIFIALWWLPMVKSLFILTSMLFSVILHQFMKLWYLKSKLKNLV